ncbi:hypothetical protein CCM_07087 [Cordyceps militaris CM01]|uniref:Aggrecan core n=1 Tax=Cordyceps militaris (strain CM01) TaxID=983644 RepID=G3JLU3_CORMM|nr:uncharacterized protein CCM_07087 [Cordyceps militaris CM01]EGX90667.1 hypothetical protein CCM_07087 [Cordyceps militaris CM01]
MSSIYQFSCQLPAANFRKRSSACQLPANNTKILLPSFITTTTTTIANILATRLSHRNATQLLTNSATRRHPSAAYTSTLTRMTLHCASSQAHTPSGTTQLVSIESTSGPSYCCAARLLGLVHALANGLSQSQNITKSSRLLPGPGLPSACSAHLPVARHCQLHSHGAPGPRLCLVFSAPFNYHAVPHHIAASSTPLPVNTQTHAYLAFWEANTPVQQDCFLSAIVAAGPRTQSPPETTIEEILQSNNLDEILAKHNLALVPRSQLTDTLTELTALLKRQEHHDRVDPRISTLFRRQNATNAQSGTSTSSASAPLGNQNGLLDGLLDPAAGLASIFDPILKPLTDLVKTLQAVTTLLTPEFISGVHDGLIGLGKTLADPIPEKIRNIVTAGEPIINELGKLDLASLISQLEPLLKELGGIDLAGLFEALKPLLAGSEITKIISIIDGAEPLIAGLGKLDLASLITQLEPILKEIGGLDLAGLFEALKPLLSGSEITKIISIIDGAEPLIAGLGKLDLASLIDQLEPLLKQLSGIDLAGLLEAVKPLLTADEIKKIQSIIDGAEPLIASLGKLDLASLIDQLEPLLKQLSGLDLAGLLEAVKPLLAPDEIKKIISIVDGAEPLIASLGQLDLQDLIKQLEPLIKQLSGLDLAGLLEAVKPLLAPEEITKIISIIDGAAPLLASLGKVDLTKLFDQLGPVLEAIGQIDLKGLVDTVAPLLTPETIQGLVLLLFNVEQLITSDFVEQTQSLISGAAPLVASLGKLDLQNLLTQLQPIIQELGQLDLKGLFDALKPLLTADTIGKLVDIVNGAAPLIATLAWLD